MCAPLRAEDLLRAKVKAPEWRCALSEPALSVPPIVSRYSHLIPKDYKANLIWRKMLVEESAKDPVLQRELWKMCSQDILFYINAFCWIFEPRPDENGEDCGGIKHPFITYPYQDHAIIAFVSHLGKKDLGAEKSRDVGASWIVCTVYEWAWKYRKNVSLLMISLKEEAVDKPDNPKALFQKLDFIRDHQPTWMQPLFVRTHMHYKNLEQGGVIDGETTTQHSSTGDRRTSLYIDELSKIPSKEQWAIFAATRDVSRSRFFTWTPFGVGNAAFELHEKAGRGEFHLLVMHWPLHPEKAKGIYFTDEVTTGVTYAGRKARSIWYDEQIPRALHPMEIAQELDLSYLGSASQFFDQADLAACEKLDTQPPWARGYLKWDRETLVPERFIPDPQGPLLLWIAVDGRGRAPAGDYCLGGDVAAGTGASDSTLFGLDRVSRTQVLAFADNRIYPQDLARLAVVICRWLANADGEPAKLNYEENGGHGKTFIETILRETTFRNIRTRVDESESTATWQGKKYGWNTGKENKKTMLGDVRYEIKRPAKLIIRDINCVREMAEYQYMPGESGGVEHARASNNPDPSANGENHGDRVIALCMARMCCDRVEVERVKLDPKENPPVHSYAWYEEQERLEAEKAGNGGNHYRPRGREAA